MMLPPVAPKQKASLVPAALAFRCEVWHGGAMTSDRSVCDLTATALARAIAKGELSSREVVEAHLERIAHRDVQLAAFVTVDAEGARRGAQICDAAPAPIGPLHGVPVGIKDLTDTAGLATTYGSVLFRDHVPAEDDLVVTRLRRAGAIILERPTRRNSASVRSAPTNCAARPAIRSIPR